MPRVTYVKIFNVSKELSTSYSWQHSTIFNICFVRQFWTFIPLHWCHMNITASTNSWTFATTCSGYQQRKHLKWASLAFDEGHTSVTSGFSLQSVCDAESVPISWGDQGLVLQTRKSHYRAISHTLQTKRCEFKAMKLFMNHVQIIDVFPN